MYDNSLVVAMAGGVKEIFSLVCEHGVSGIVDSNKNLFLFSIRVASFDSLQFCTETVLSKYGS